MDGYAVDPAALTSADVLLDAAVSDARSALRVLCAEAAATTWSGAAGAAFRAGWQEWADGCEQSLAALAQLAGALGGAGRQYAVTEDAVAAAARA